VKCLVLVMMICAAPLLMASVTDTAGKPTVVVIDEAMRTCIDDLTHAVRAGDTVDVSVSAHPDAAWVRASLIQQLTTKGTIVTEQGGKGHHVLSVVPVDLRTAYTTTDAADTVVRTITVSLTATLDTPQRGISSVPCSTVVQERLSREQALRLQSDQHAATRADLPPKPTSIWQDIVEPAVFIGAAVVTVVLLFTVRSQ
jgi:hypothetical protein